MDFFNTQVDPGQYTDSSESGLTQETASTPVFYYLDGVAILLVLVGIVGLAVQIARLKSKRRKVSQIKMLERMWKMTPEKIED